MGSALTLAGAALLAGLPSGASIRDSALFVLGDITLGKIVDTGGALAAPLAIIAVLLLLATGALWLSGRRDEVPAGVCVVQPVLGVLAIGGSIVSWVLVLAAAVLTILIYAALTYLGFQILRGFLG